MCAEEPCNGGDLLSNLKNYGITKESQLRNGNVFDVAGNSETRVSVSGSELSGTGRAVRMQVEITNIPFTQTNGVREYHDGESSYLGVSFKAYPAGVGGDWELGPVKVECLEG